MLGARACRRGSAAGASREEAQMSELGGAVLLAVQVITALLVVAVLLLLRRQGGLALLGRIEAFERLLEKTERAVREEVAHNREELSQEAHQQRSELREALRLSGEAVEARLSALAQTTAERLDQLRSDAAVSAREGREELSGSLKETADSLMRNVGELGQTQKSQLEAVTAQIARLTESNERKLTELQQQLEARLLQVSASVDAKLGQIQQDNERRLEQIRATVDEKLQGTLEQRLGESFRTVSQQLEQVHKGLGEMQSLAAGVGDLKKVLTNVKTRGTWGEVQLQALLEQILIPDQFACNVATKHESSERVEFAIKLPGRDDARKAPVWLPIDAKFPVEDYQRLVDAADRADVAAVEAAAKQLETRIWAAAGDIHDKYLDPPNTTDFGIMYLPTEGLYAEVLRRPGLLEQLQRECHVIVTGPTTLAALLSSLQMGFRTLAIEKRSSEVWRVLGAVKTEFGKFGEVIEKVQKKLNEASNTIEDAAKRGRAVQRKLREVEALPAAEAQELLPGGPAELE
jgi:DNA recombination protein RmuC